MSKNSATVIKDGQLAVATVPQTGTLVGAASEIDATALVETTDGLQLCVKTCEVGGGGGGGTVDQTYDPTSTNAQSGTAVAEAVAPALKNTATGTNSLTILGTATTQINAVNVGQSSRAVGASSVAVGYNAMAGTDSIAIGSGVASGTNNHKNCIAINGSAGYGDYSIAIGGSSYSQKNVVLGHSASVYKVGSIAIGYGAVIGDFVTPNTGEHSIQIGKGTTLEPYTLNIGFDGTNYKLLDGTTGKIPMGRLPIVQCTQAEYDALVSGGTVDSNTIYCIVPA